MIPGAMLGSHQETEESQQDSWFCVTDADRLEIEGKRSSGTAYQGTGQVSSLLYK
jgi:hypothetical protein